MKRTKNDIERLRAELLYDLDQIDLLLSSNEKAMERISAGADDYLDFAALGYTIHNLYSLMENACFRVAKFFENSLVENSWHKDLLDRMRLDIEGARPALLNEDTYQLLDDLRAFRHVFRNLYAKPIDKDKVMLIQSRVPKAVSGFRDGVSGFLQFLKDLKGAVDT